ncbi:protein of unknown function [Tranquillimonas rosea]|uniref:DUF4186 domain-containing protein n=1 Tax=Tranquillimonas rosea TaxID=641238 RepID=A0A1H9UBJ5_9RHOB|nr:DUF4186 domain-containing protein [Tranquillimonas rosea]SES06719.1 protein of unknown function [Tranquillimonas rosea]
MDGQDDLFARLARSRFRSRFRLNGRDRAYADSKGRDTILSHARDFVRQRLAPAAPPNDGRQTPMRGHPVFVAQHATATCCRECLWKWHGYKPGRTLEPDEQEQVVGVLIHWIDREMGLVPQAAPDTGVRRK